MLIQLRPWLDIFMANLPMNERVPVNTCTRALHEDGPGALQQTDQVVMVTAGVAESLFRLV